MSGEHPALDRLLEIQVGLPRGPSRNGALAIWLVARVAWDIGRGDDASSRGERRRLELLAHRLKPLVMPAPLERGLVTALGHLDAATPAAARVALSQLVAPAHETIGAAAGEALALLTRDLHRPAAGEPGR